VFLLFSYWYVIFSYARIEAETAKNYYMSEHDAEQVDGEIQNTFDMIAVKFF
jgi:hypothetical protein